MITKQFRFLLFFLVYFLGYSLLQAKTVKYTISSITSVNTTGEVPIGSSAIFSTTSSTSSQLTAGNTMTLILSGFNTKTITGLSLSMKSTTSTGKGYFSMECGSDTIAYILNSNFSSSSWNGAYTTNYVNITPTFTSYRVNNSKDIIIKITATANSLYCQSFSINYDDSSTKELQTLTLSGLFKNNFNINDSFSHDGMIVTANYTDGSTVNATSKSEFYGFDMKKSGIQIVNISYSDSNSTIYKKYKIAVGLNKVALVAPYSGRNYAVKADGSFGAAEVNNMLNGKIISSDNNIAWTITLIDDQFISIKNNDNNYLTGSSTTALGLLPTEFKSWALSLDNSHWTYSLRSIIYSSTSSGIFKNYDISNIGSAGYATDYTKIYPIAESYARSNLIVNTIGTICLPNDVNIDDYKGANFFEIIGVIKKTADMNVDDITGIAIKPVTTLSAGKPYIYQAIENSFILAYTGNPVSEPIYSNGLIGNISGNIITVGASDDSHWNYVISGNQLHKITGTGQANISNNRAYINLYGVPIYSDTSSAAKIISLENQEITDINSYFSFSDNEELLYRFDGVKIHNDIIQKGLYILNGKKYIKH